MFPDLVKDKFKGGWLKTIEGSYDNAATKELIFQLLGIGQMRATHTKILLCQFAVLYKKMWIPIVAGDCLHWNTHGIYEISKPYTY